MSDQGYWFVALGLGVVVAIVVVALLQLFLREVHRIETGAGLVWTAGKQVARNTSTTWLLGETSSRLDEIIDEAGRHGQLLRGEPVDPDEITGPAGRATTTGTTGGPR